MVGPSAANYLILAAILAALPTASQGKVSTPDIENFANTFCREKFQLNLKFPNLIIDLFKWKCN